MADDDDHLRPDDYLPPVAGDGANRLALRTHAHLVDACPECAANWDELGPMLQGLYRENLAKIPVAAPLADPDPAMLSGAAAALEVLASTTATLGRYRRRAMKQLSELRTLPAHRRADTVRGAYRRFRSRQLAELLVEESRSVVRNAPAEAESFASLVPLVLKWTQGPNTPPWAPPLLARAAAHQANALRVAGDLAAAETAFLQLHRFLATHPIADPSVLAEITSLEASLRSDQRRFGCATELLRRSALAFRFAGDDVGLARTQLQRANLLRIQGRPDEILPLLEDAATHLRSDASPYLIVCTVTGRVNALCDLDRPAEARDLLRRHLDSFDADESLHTGALLRCLEGRVALGLGDHAAAEHHFQASHDGMLLAGRPLDAAGSALYLAEILLRQGRPKQLRHLASRLVQEFRSRGIEGEALVALRLLAQAVATEELTLALLVEIRHRLSCADSARASAAV